ncbi:hypothetical protein F4809DRAFT_640858 [Biscogniauxia mediterranea]|nr:hypothetical protein F4809DRAFT_640858 [Biscogniauxia mediterranea]
MAQVTSKTNSRPATIAAHLDPSVYYESPTTKMGVRQPDDEAPAYVLQWRQNQEEVSKEDITSANDLRLRIDDELKDERQRLFVIRGLPVDYLEVLRDMLNIDPYFVEAHARRKNYRPRGRRKDGAMFAHYDYPEMMHVAPADGDVERTPGAATYPNILGGPLTHIISKRGDGVLFCRASLWLGLRANVLFLDCPLRRKQTSDHQMAMQLTRRLHPEVIPTAGKPLILEVETDHAAASEAPSFETLLCESLTGSCESGLDLWHLVESIAVHQWFDFFDTVPVDLPLGSAETIAMYWQAQNSLERNLGNPSPPLGHSLAAAAAAHQAKPPDPGWEALLARMGRRTQLLSRLNPVVANVQVPPSSVGEAARRAADRDRGPAGQGDDYFNSEENKRALDRVAYMGGVLLPLSIVSGILSMGDPFGPGGGLFYVFWATAVPLTLVTLLVIYADSIRKAQVWIEVAAHPAEQAAAVEEGHGGVSATTSTMTTPQGFAHASHDEGDRHPYYYYSQYRPGYRPMGADTFAERVHFVEKMFSDTKEKRWRKEELGWIGACMTALRLYKLRTGAPPAHLREERRVKTT